MIINCDAEHRNLSSRERKFTVGKRNQGEVASRRNLKIRYRGYSHSAFYILSNPWTYVHGY
jgi:hypothetical protein